MVTPLPTQTQTATSSPTATSTATTTPLPPTETPAPFTSTPTATETTWGTSTPTQLATAIQLEIFQDLWNIVNDKYLYPDFNGIDWNAVYAEYLGKIQGGLSNQEFYQAMKEMIFRLGDDHSVYLTPEEATEENAELEGDYNYAGIGVLLTAIPELNRAAVVLTFPGSPADQAGLQPRDAILTVNAEPILSEDGNLRDILRGEAGTQVQVLVQTPGEEAREVVMTRARITSSMPVPHQVLTSVKGKRIGYLLIVSFLDSTVDEQVEEALREMTLQGPLDGLIIDNTHNQGGTTIVFKSVLSYFTSGKLGNYISRNSQRDLTIIRGKDINGSQSFPLVILVGQDTISNGEIFSGILQDLGRAYLIGETTMGNVETLWGYDFEDGSRAWIAHESFQPINQPEANWEETGIVPDLIIPVNWYEYKLEEDPRIKTALMYFDSR